MVNGIRHMVYGIWYCIWRAICHLVYGIRYAVYAKWHIVCGLLFFMIMVSVVAMFFYPRIERWENGFRKCLCNPVQRQFLSAKWNPMLRPMASSLSGRSFGVERRKRKMWLRTNSWGLSKLSCGVHENSDGTRKSIKLFCFWYRGNVPQRKIYCNQTDVTSHSMRITNSLIPSHCRVLKCI